MPVGKVVIVQLGVEADCEDVCVGSERLLIVVGVKARVDLDLDVRMERQSHVLMVVHARQSGSSKVFYEPPAICRERSDKRGKFELAIEGFADVGRVYECDVVPR